MSFLTLGENVPSYGMVCVRRGRVTPFCHGMKTVRARRPCAGRHSWTASYGCSLEDYLIVKYLSLFSG